ncbi:putative nucleobindin [Schistosoma mansoni]|uniref:putative nucleobindin n=1 Tax=Schistosoma mansoni TaxID=6183 RepID=UPI00022DBED5|nr:putative nucleobindin [Schistosoma mansoni]|eukprot:XP_018648880.1 putative nucleobindin [Schistosoma mansoni]
MANKRRIEGGFATGGSQIMSPNSYMAPLMTLPKLQSRREAEEAAQYKKYLEEAPKAINVDPKTLDSARKVFVENQLPSFMKFQLDRQIPFNDLLLLWNTSLRDKDDETKRYLVEKLIKTHLEKAADSHRNTMGGVVHKTLPGYEAESPNKIVDKLKKLDDEQERKYQEHVAKEKSDMVQKFSKFTEEERARMLKSLKELAEKHKRHPRIHQPGSQDQLKEYWEKYEGLDEQSFNSRTLFADIDLDGDGYLNIHEVEAFLQTELEKVYNPEDPDYDPWEERHDQKKMRQKFMDRFDTDGNYLVSRDEFLRGVNQPYPSYDRDWMTAQNEEDMFKTNEEELRRLVSEAQSKEQNRQQTTTEQPNVQNV